MWSALTLILVATIFLAPLVWETAVFILALVIGIAYGVFSLACIWPCLVWGSIFGRIRLVQEVGPFLIPSLLLFFIIGHKADPTVWLLFCYLSFAMASVLLSPRTALAMSISSTLALSSRITELASGWVARTRGLVKPLHESLFNTAAIAFDRKGYPSFESGDRPAAYLNQDLGSLNTQLSPVASMARSDPPPSFLSAKLHEFRQSIFAAPHKHLKQVTCAAIAGLLPVPMIYLVRLQSDFWRVNGKPSATPTVATQPPPGDFSVAVGWRVKHGRWESPEITVGNGTPERYTDSILSLGVLPPESSLRWVQIAGHGIARNSVAGRVGAKLSFPGGETGWPDRQVAEGMFDITGVESQSYSTGKHTEARPSGKSKNATKWDNEREPTIRRDRTNTEIQNGTNNVRRPKESDSMELETSEHGTGYVTRRRIPLRDEARFGAAVSAEVGSAESIAVVERDGDWLRIKISSSGRVGYVRKEYILAVSPAQNNEDKSSRSPTDVFQIAGKRGSSDQQE
jgi:hypothetical protein